MATNFDATRLAVQTAFPTNDLLFDDKEMPSIHVFIPKFRPPKTPPCPIRLTGL